MKTTEPDTKETYVMPDDLMQLDSDIDTTQVGACSHQEHLILVDAANNEIGSALKLPAHEQGLLHRAFSVFIVNRDGEILMQRRAAVKYHSAGRWSNTCCGHPRPGERVEVAALRRLGEEMGIACELKSVAVFQYRTDVGHGLIENEIDHLFIGVCDDAPLPTPEEVSEWMYIPPDALAASISQAPDDFSAWLPMAFNHVRPHLISG
ncbi:MULTISPECIES: isopentenyl-diphosphate Delta-isomerase [Cupriavidus]|nr:isopentenyl-diphosphate Delta-isomerase [Cupriavidus taiwanensis]